LAVRRREPALQLGTLELLEVGDERVLAYERRLDERALLVALNFGEEACRVTFPAGGEILASTGERGGTVSETLELGPYEGLVLARS
jgi:glycosidase